MDARTENYAHAPTAEPAIGLPPAPRTGRLVRIARLIETYARPAGPAVGDAAAVRRLALLAYTGASILVGVVLLAWTTAAVPIATPIDPGLSGTALASPLGGMLLWVLFGFLGSVRVLRAPGGSGTLTFHLPFIGAAMVLGGPTAGAWVAFLSTLERRELEEQPWYGLLANHSVMVIAAVAGGLVAELVRGQSADAPGAGPAVVAAVVAMAVLYVISTAMAGVTVMLRDEISLGDCLMVMREPFGRLSLLEVAVAWVLVVAYLQIGWWAPAVVGALVLAVWDNDPMPSPDDLTGLVVRKAFIRRLGSGLGRLRRGALPGATLFSIDLDGFKSINDSHGHDVGDEVLREVGRRVRAQARRPGDVPGRMGGDEIDLFLPGLVDRRVAMRRADEVVEAISAPIITRVGPLTVGASVGVIVVDAWGGVPAAGTVMRHADSAMYIAKRRRLGAHLYDPSEATTFDEDAIDQLP